MTEMTVQNQTITPGWGVHLRYGGDKTFWIQTFDPDGVTVHVLNEHDVDLAVPRADIVSPA